MKVNIKVENISNPSDSMEITELANMLERACGVTVDIHRVSLGSKVKSVGLVDMLSIANLAVTLLSTFIAGLSYWKSTRPSYSATLSMGNKTYVIENLSKEKLNQVVAELENDYGTSEFEILISKK